VRLGAPLSPRRTIPGEQGGVHDRRDRRHSQRQGAGLERNGIQVFRGIPYAAPPLGEHNEAVFRGWFGLSAEEFESLSVEGVFS